MGPAVAAPDLLLIHADVHTMDDARPRAAEIAITGGVITAIGDHLPRDGVPRVVDLGGRVVLPGFVDAHMHPVEGGLELVTCPLFDAEDLDALAAALRACPGRGWLEGTGWQLPLFPAEGPTAAALDAILGDRPALLWAADGHSAWVDSAALRRAGLTAATPDPPGGRVERLPDGSPRGTLRESAIDLVADLLPAPRRAALDAGLAQAVALANRHGVTTALDACADRAIIDTWTRAARGGLTLRATVAVCADDARGAEQVPELVRLAARARGVHADVAKMYVDGVLEARTAATLTPYLDAPDAPLVHDPAELTALVRALAAAGFGVHAHAIGDGAVRATLDAMAAARADGARTTMSVAHLELVHPDDLPRFAALGVAPVFQPLWAYPDDYVRELTWPGLDPSLRQALYPIGAALRAGAALAFGSDWSVSSLAPLEGIEVAVTRRDPDAGGAPLGEDQAVSIDAAVRAYTVGAAAAIGREAEAGLLAPGRPADLAVLTADPWATAPERLAEIDVAATLFGGATVWSDGSIAGL